jgi:1-acyl-sn-glycerol-3-phosphate acyltransferase
VLSYAVIPDYFVFTGKQELNKAPLFRIFFKEMNILVDRKSRLGSHKAFVKAAHEIEMGNSMFFFPEGTISNLAPELRSFKNGAFKLALEKQVPIVPVTFLNNWKLLQNGGFFKSNGRPGVARVIIHKPVVTAGMTEEDLVPLREKIFSIINNDLKQEYEN